MIVPNYFLLDRDRGEGQDPAKDGDLPFYIQVCQADFNGENPQNFSLSIVPGGLLTERQGLLIELKSDDFPDLNVDEWLLADVPDDVIELISEHGGVVISDTQNNKVNFTIENKEKLCQAE